MVCFDTNFLIELLRKKQEAIQKLQDMITSGEDMKTTTINASELYKGAYKTQRPEEIIKVEDILKTLEVLPHDKDSAKLFGELYYTPIIKSKNPGDMDLLIASIALNSNEKILTKNVRHFNIIPNLTVETW